MVTVVKKPDTLEKLKILTADAQYDLACACGSRENEHRKRGNDGKWIYPVTLANGEKGSLFRTLISNACVNDCKYCPLRADSNAQRCTMNAEETASAFGQLYSSKKVFGAFLTSGVRGSADESMDRLIETAHAIRRRNEFRGYLHLKVIPGASDGAVEEALKIATAVSINIETPGAEFFSRLSAKKNFNEDIIRPLKLLSKLTGRGERYEGKSVTTQFIVGAAGEADRNILHYMAALYDRLKLHRVYFSAYQKGLGDIEIPGESGGAGGADIFTREHRLYQADFLLRKYGFKEKDFGFDKGGNFDLVKDPKQVWADMHPEFFPVNVNKASKWELLRVPGLGPEAARRILAGRKSRKIRNLEDLETLSKRFKKVQYYLIFD